MIAFSHESCNCTETHVGPYSCTHDPRRKLDYTIELVKDDVSSLTVDYVQPAAPRNRAERRRAAALARQRK